MDLGLIYVAVFLLGALIGSFLNVCIHRLPRAESVVWPASHCPACRHRIAPYDNIPLLSYLWLAGRCRHCRTRIALRYPVVELFNAIGYVVILWEFGPTAEALVYAGLFSALIVVTWVDLSHQIIPDRITLPGMLLGLVAAGTVLPVGLINGALGLLAGGGSLWFLAWVSPYIFGKEGMGGGDIKLMAMVGAFLGWKPTLMTIMLGAALGSVVGVALIALRVIKRDDYLPFGPFLAAGAMVSLLFYTDLLSWYFSLLPAP